MRNGLIVLCLSFVIYSAVPPVFAVTSSTHTTRIIALVSPMPRRVVRRPATKNQSILQKIWSVIGPGILGSVGVIAGSAVAWYTLQKKNKTFSSYYSQIAEAQTQYEQELTSGVSKQAAKSKFKHRLTLIQEEAELTAAQKKLDGEQLTAIINKVQRMLNAA